MRILAFDCATSACSAAVLEGEDVLAHRFAEMARGQSETLVPMIADVLTDADIAVAGLDLLAVTIGPGAFTGVRIGLATARAMALASGLPLAGVTTLEAVACRQPAAAGATLVALETKRADIYIQLFARNGESLTVPAAVAPDAILAALPEAPAVVAGDAASRACAALGAAGIAVPASSDSGLPDAREVGLVAARRAVRGELPAAEPLYLRAPDVGPPRWMEP